MENEYIFELLYNKDTSEIYNKFKLIENNINNSNELYEYFDDFLKMILNKNSYIRVRGFRLICALAKWDINNKINKNIESILNCLNDDKPTAIRQYIATLEQVIKYKPELIRSIRNAICEINLLRYKESMSKLISKDIDNSIKLCDIYSKEEII